MLWCRQFDPSIGNRNSLGPMPDTKTCEHLANKSTIYMLEKVGDVVVAAAVSFVVVVVIVFVIFLSFCLLLLLMFMHLLLLLWLLLQSLCSTFT